jgi:hypothetical protein
MAVNLSPVGGVAAQFFDNNGVILTGGKIFTYTAGTTTPQVTYTSASGVTAHSNPIILDASGRVPSGEIWLTDGLSYKFLLKDANDVLIGTYDNVNGINSNFINYTGEQEIQTATANQTVFTLTTMQYQPGTNSLSVFVDGVNQYGPGAQYAFVETSATVITFVNGLHVGASVKFTTATINSAAATSADQVSYTPAGTGAVATNVQAKLRQTVSVKDFGAVGDGVVDDTAAIQAAITFATANDKAVLLNDGEYKLTSAITITAGVAIFGQGIGVSRLLCVNCNAFNISAGVTFVTLMDFTIANASRYTVTPNTNTAISINGTTATQCYWHTYQNLFIDGFQVGFFASGISSSVWNNVTTVYTHQSVNFSTQCLNNAISQCRFGEVDSGAIVPAAGSYGIKVGDGVINCEGLTISDTLIFGVHRGVWIRASINVYINSNILDMINEFGVLAESTAAAGCLNNNIVGNYIGVIGASGDSGVYLANSYAPTDPQNRGTLVRDNEILAYAGATLNYGILIDGTSETRNLVSGNKVQNTFVYDCNITAGSGHRVSDNLWRSTNGFYNSVAVSYINNVGVITSTAYPSPIGTFTPTIIGTSSAGVGTYTTQIGYYKIIDSLCYFNLRVVWTGHTGTGDMKIAGLPVACKNVVGYAPSMTVNPENLTFPAGATSVIGLVNTATTNVELRGAGTGLAPTPVAMDTTGNLNVAGFYDIS